MSPETNGFQIRETGVENKINKNEAFNMLVPSSDLAWILGVLSGRGSVTNHAVFLNSKRNPELLTKFSVVGQTLFRKQPHVKPNKIYFYSSQAAREIGDLTNNAWVKTIQSRHKWILGNSDFTWKFIEGFFDTRADLKTKPRYPGNTLRFRTSNFTNADFIKNLLLAVGIQKPTIFPDEDQPKETQYTVSVYRIKDLKVVADHIHPKSPEKQDQLRAIKEEDDPSRITETDLYVEWVRLGRPDSSYKLIKLYQEGQTKYSRSAYERILGEGSFKKAVYELKKLDSEDFEAKRFRRQVSTQIGKDERKLWTYAVNHDLITKIIETGILTSEELGSIRIYFETNCPQKGLNPGTFLETFDRFSVAVANLA